MICSCGNPEPHVIVSRETADGLRLYLYDVGAITGPLGYKVPGVPLSRPRTDEQQAEALALGHLFMGDVELYDRDELADWHKACRWAAKRNGLPGDARKRFAQITSPRLTPEWTTLHADRDGRPTERFWRLPRLRWPGLAVFDYCGGPGSRRGRYVLHSRIADTPTIYQNSGDETWEPTGFAFSRLSDLFKHLEEL